MSACGVSLARVARSLVSALVLGTSLLLLSACDARPVLPLWNVFFTSVNSTPLLAVLTQQKLQNKLEELELLAQAFALSGNVSFTNLSSG